MMAARLCRIPITAFVSGLQKPSVLKPVQTNFPRIQLYANEAKTASRRVGQRKSLKEMAMAPAGVGSFTVGRGFLAGSSVIGLGALCFYGLGMSQELGDIERAVLWPQKVRLRIRLTAGVVGALSTVAMWAPSEKFLSMVGPLAVGLGLVFASSLRSMFLPPTTALGAGLFSISIYGGLVLLSMFLLYDTQKIIKKAETHPIYGVKKYDPINAMLGIYLDTINIFSRIAMILSGGGGRRKSIIFRTATRKRQQYA